MKVTRLFTLMGILSLHTVFAQEYDQNAFGARLAGAYLGQKPPGLTAEVFAPGMVSTELYELFSAFTPDMKEFYFVRYDEDDKPSMIVYKYEDNQWNESITGPRVGEPFISNDGKIMHLGRKYMERTDTGWSELKSLDSPFKDMRIMRLTTSSKGTYYFDEAKEEIPIRYSRLVNGKREAPQTLNLDLGIFNAHPFIAPDESWLIWDDQRAEGYGNADIYITYKQQDGSWGPAINLGDRINSAESDSYATITPDGKYMLFNRKIDENNVDIYWVDASFIETLRPK
ncbi:TolB-like translocation protein [Ekhidna sp.]